MKLEHYTLKAGTNKDAFEFDSIGPKGNIPKLIQFTLVDEEINVYNLGFGDLNKDTGELDDKVVTDNGDTDRVLATVVEGIYAFYRQTSNAWVYATGSTPARTRLYRMGLNKYIDIVVEDFEIFGQQPSGDWEIYKKNCSYQAFLVYKKF